MAEDRTPMAGLWDLAAAIAAGAVDVAAAAARSPRRTKRKKSWETAEFGAMVERQLRAYGRRVRESGDVEALAHLATLRALVEVELAASVTALRSEQGYSWADVGRALGIKRQTAQERFGS